MDTCKLNIEYPNIESITPKYNEFPKVDILDTIATCIVETYSHMRIQLILHVDNAPISSNILKIATIWLLKII